MRLQPTHNLSQGCVIRQEMRKGDHQSRLKRTMTNTLSAVFCSDLALLGNDDYKGYKELATQDDFDKLKKY